MHHNIKLSNESPTDDVDFFIDEMDEVNCDENDNFFSKLEYDWQDMQFLSDIGNEEETYHNFIKHLHSNSVSKYLVAKSQDKHVSKT